jgi:hypothetical protein
MYYKELYQTLSNAIESIKDSTNQPLFRWIDFDMAQTEQDNPPLSYPSALIGFDDLTDLSDYANGSQQGTQVVSVSLVFKVFERTHSKASMPFREEALKHLDTVSLVHHHLNNLTGMCFSGLTRIGMTQDRRADLRIYTLRYACRIFDDANNADKINIKAYVPWATATGVTSAHPDLNLTEDIVP